MWLINALCLQLVFLTISRVLGEKCQTLAGTWFDESGSELQLNHTKDGILAGLYIPKNVNEFKRVYLRVEEIDIIGSAIFNESNVIFGFSTTFNNNFVKSWTGQCLPSQDREVLHATWMLYQSVKSCSDKGQSTNIGQSVFTRIFSSNMFSPKEKWTSSLLQRTGFNNYSLKGVEKKYSSEKSKVSAYGGKLLKKFRPAAQHTNCSLNGYWYNQHGSEMIITVHENMTLSGEYRTAVETSQGAVGKTFSKISGVANPTGSNSPISLHVIWSNGTSATVWVGQCLWCGKNQTQVLVTNWLLRSKVEFSNDNWKAVFYGQDVFTRSEQKMGPRKSLGMDTPGQLNTSSTSPKPSF